MEVVISSDVKYIVDEFIFVENNFSLTSGAKLLLEELDVNVNLCFDYIPEIIFDIPFFPRGYYSINFDCKVILSSPTFEMKLCYNNIKLNPEKNSKRYFPRLKKEIFTSFQKKKIILSKINISKEEIPEMKSHNSECPVCLEEIESDFKKLKCGHCIDLECFSQLEIKQRKIIECPMCRDKEEYHTITVISPNSREKSILLVDEKFLNLDATSENLISLFSNRECIFYPKIEIDSILYFSKGKVRNTHFIVSYSPDKEIYYSSFEIAHILLGDEDLLREWIGRFYSLFPEDGVIPTREEEGKLKKYIYKSGIIEDKEYYIFTYGGGAKLFFYYDDQIIPYGHVIPKKQIRDSRITDFLISVSHINIKYTSITQEYFSSDEGE